MRMILVAVLGLAFAAPASAQQLTLSFHEGLVSLDAAAVPVKTILSEWGRLGGTTVVGAERITGAPLTIRLENVPEAQALEVVLRNVAGYMAAPRRAESLGASAYDRILVMPTSATAASATTARPGANGNNLAGTQRGVRQGAAPPPQAEEPVMQDGADSGVNEPAFSFPQQNPNPFQAIGQPGQPGPFGTPIPPGAQSPVVQFGPATGGQAISVNPTQEQQMPVMQFPGAAPPANGPTGGFGVVGSPTPGMIVQPAQPAQPGVRPPGGE
jgi:hypothetical protein